MWSKAGDMNKERIETGKAPQLLIGACDGDLIIRGGSEPTLHVRGEYTTEETADGYRLCGRGRSQTSRVCRCAAARRA